MAEIGLTEAAKLTGKDPSTIARRSNHKNAMKRLSFRISETGEKLYDVSELERVFGKLKIQDTQDARNSANTLHSNDLQDALQVSHLRECELLRDKADLLHVQLESINKDRDHWRQQATYLLEDRSKKEVVINTYITSEQELRERLAQEKAQQAQSVQRIAEMQNSLDKVRNSWIGRLLFKV